MLKSLLLLAVIFFVAGLLTGIRAQDDSDDTKTTITREDVYMSRACNSTGGWYIDNQDGDKIVMICRETKQ